VAIQFELAAAEFYQQLQPQVSKPLRWLVESLAEEEKDHAERLGKLRYHPDLYQEIQQQIETPVTNLRFSDGLHTPDPKLLKSDQDVLQYALSRERLAMEQYRALAEATEPGEVKELFQWLADEEIEHKSELEKRYYALVHRGGGV
jgi:rubrerythrin